MFSQNNFTIHIIYKTWLVTLAWEGGGEASRNIFTLWRLQLGCLISMLVLTLYVAWKHPKWYSGGRNCQGFSNHMPFGSSLTTILNFFVMVLHMCALVRSQGQEIFLSSVLKCPLQLRWVEWKSSLAFLSNWGNTFRRNARRVCVSLSAVVHWRTTIFNCSWRESLVH